MALEKRPLEKRHPIGNHYFLGSMLVLGWVSFEQSLEAWRAIIKKQLGGHERPCHFSRFFPELLGPDPGENPQGEPQPLPGPRPRRWYLCCTGCTWRYGHWDQGVRGGTIDSTDSPKSNSKFALEKWRVGSDGIFLFLGMALFLVCPWESWCRKTICLPFGLSCMGLVEDAYMNQHCTYLKIYSIFHT